MIKLAMIQVSRWLEKEGVHANMIMQVHDELVFEVNSAIVAEFVPRVKKIMESVMSLEVPLVVDVATGENWGALQPFSLELGVTH